MRGILKFIGITLVLYILALCNFSSGKELVLKKTFRYNHGGYLDYIPSQTDIDRAKFILRRDGLPILKVKDIGEIEHPAFIALYALEYAGEESYYHDLINVKKDLKLLKVCVNWLEEHLKKVELPGGRPIYVWLYNFDNTYNNVYIKAPWYSAFGQAVGIEALLTAYKHLGDKRYLLSAERAAIALMTPLNEGGLLFRGSYSNQKVIWFEEIPVPVDNPPHILNGHLRTLIALYKLYEATGEKVYLDYFKQGIDSLKILLPLYDTGYWLKYDLNTPLKLLLRLNNPYGFKLYPLAIDKIELYDPVTGIRYVEDVGDEDDFKEDELYLAGIDWGSSFSLNGVTYRRVKPVVPPSLAEELNSESLLGPHVYVYVKLPTRESNLYSEPYVLTLSYLDEELANMELELKSIAPRLKFVSIECGELLLKGDRKVKDWKLILNPRELGYYVGKSYGVKHYLYLNKLCDYSGDMTLCAWSQVAKSYINMLDLEESDYVKVNLPEVKLPRQTPMLPECTIDANGVQMYSIATEQKFTENGLLKGGGKPVYHPFIISWQVLYGRLYIPNIKCKTYSKGDHFEIKREPALRWLLRNARCRDEFCLWRIPVSNAYNDIYTPSNWQSAFVQAYVIKALLYARDEMGYHNLDELIRKAVNAYGVEVDRGGLMTRSKEGLKWYEEVPNKTHILNAHLISLNTLKETCDKLSYQRACKLYEDGLRSLKHYVNRYDNGYWTIYDLNPKKQLLFQLDWVRGSKSILVDKICLLNPMEMSKTCIDVGAGGDFEGQSRLTGIDWESKRVIDNRTARGFKNGYSLRREAVRGGARHNVFFWLRLPFREERDLFDIMPLWLVIDYKDISPGLFAVKIQVNNEGNYLKFTPLRKSLIVAKGDGKWRQAVIPLRPQDMGWYMGVDYQKYHIEQLKSLSENTDDPLLNCYLKRWKWELEAFRNGLPVIYEDLPRMMISIPDTPVKVQQVKVNFKTYKGYGIENALDGDPNDDYVAGLEGQKLPFDIELFLEGKPEIVGLKIVWESAENFAGDYEIIGYRVLGPIKWKVFSERFRHNRDKENYIVLNPVRCDVVKLRIYKLNGQARVLLRQIVVYGK